MNDRDIIFLLEDSSTLQDILREAIEKDDQIKAMNMMVSSCQSIVAANILYEEVKNRIACIVCDSNMPSFGLSIELRSESGVGLYSGWLWLAEKIKDNETLANRSLIYSAYCDELRTVMYKNPALRKIPCIRKSLRFSKNDEIIEEIVRILKGR